MNRKYTVEQYREKIELFRAACPDWALTTDLIVGFPGESDEDFAQTLELCEWAGFAQAYCFIYSTRRGTPAALWEQLDPQIGSARLKRLMQTIDAGVRAFHDRKLGSTVRVLVHGPSRKDPSKISGKTIDNVTVVAPLGEMGLAQLVARPWLDIRVESAHVWGCAGTLVGTAERYDGTAEAVAFRPLVDLIGLAR